MVRRPVPGAPAGVTAFVNVAVVPMDAERVLAGQTVVVKNGWITALGPTGQTPIPSEAVRIDGAGKYLIPGLADCHAHIGFRVRDTVEAERRLLLYALHGVTTIRNLDYMHDKGLDGPSLLRLRARAAGGELLSPQIYTSGPWGPRPYIGQRADFEKPTQNIPTPVLDSVAAYVAAYKAAGYDFLKVHDESQAIRDSLAAVTRRLGVPLVGHARPKTGIDYALASGGYTSIEHLDEYLGEGQGRPIEGAELAARTPLLVAATKRGNIWNCPTLILKAKVQHGRLPGSRVLVRALQDAGAGLLLGTDAPAGGLVPGLSVHEELEQLVLAGLTPYQALQTGTRNVAVYFGTLDETGTITSGKRADLVLLRGNPLEDIRNTLQPAGVVIGGRWLSRTEIDRRLSP